MRVRVTYPQGFINPPGRTEVETLKLWDVALTDRETNLAHKVEIIDDDGVVLKVLKDRNGPVG